MAQTTSLPLENFDQHLEHYSWALTEPDDKRNRHEAVDKHHPVVIYLAILRDEAVADFLNHRLNIDSNALQAELTDKINAYAHDKLYNRAAMGHFNQWQGQQTLLGHDPNAFMIIKANRDIFFPHSLVYLSRSEKHRDSFSPYLLLEMIMQEGAKFPRDPLLNIFRTAGITEHLFLDHLNALKQEQIDLEEQRTRARDRFTAKMAGATYLAAPIVLPPLAEAIHKTAMWASSPSRIPDLVALGLSAGVGTAAAWGLGKLIKSAFRGEPSNKRLYRSVKVAQAVCITAMANTYINPIVQDRVSLDRGTLSIKIFKDSASNSR